MSNSNELFVPKQERKSIDVPEKSGADPKEFIIAILNSKLFIVFLSSIAFIISFVIAYGQPSIYQANTLLRVESKKATVPGLDSFANFKRNNISISTEIELIKAREILSEVIKSLKLDIIAQPRRVRHFSYFYQHFFSPTEATKLPLIWDSFDQWAYPYAWGNEKIKVSHFAIPDEFINQSFIVVNKKDDNFNLMSGGKVLLSGKIGKRASSKDNRFSIFIPELIGREGTEFIVSKVSERRARVMLKGRILAAEQGTRTALLNLSIMGRDKQLIVKILDKIANIYIKQNKERSAEEASNALVFLKEQIKPVKRNMDRAETALRKYLIQNQTADLLQESESVLAQVVEIDEGLRKLSLLRQELKQKYTVNHPKFKIIIAKETLLNTRKSKIKGKILQLPIKQQKLLGLQRDIEVATSIYLELFNKIQEFKIAEASTVGNVYIVDSAEAAEAPINPKSNRTVLGGTLLGFLLALGIVILRKMLRFTVDNPEKLEEVTGIPVYITVPFSKNVILTSGLKGKKKRPRKLLAKQDMTDPAIESLRSLRTSLHFALHEAKNNIVLITGPSPNIGKSFITSNFAATIATTNQKVVIIDADMRKGYLHQLFDLSMSPGLSDIITENVEPQDAIHTVQIADYTMDVITRGKLPPNPSELLMNNNFERLLNNLSKEYDLVLIDSAPIHAVTDPSIIGSHVGVVFMVVYSDRHSMKEIEHAVSRLAQTGIETKGFIFNGYIASKNKYGYGYNSYYGDYK